MESQPGISEVSLQDTSAKAFEYILRYMYTGKMNLLEVKVRVLKWQFIKDFNLYLHEIHKYTCIIILVFFSNSC